MVKRAQPGKIIYVNDEVGPQIKKWVGGDEKREAFIEMCEKTHSRNSKYGIHASGFLISDVPLADHVPAYLTWRKRRRRETPRHSIQHEDSRKATFYQVRPSWT